MKTLVDMSPTEQTQEIHKWARHSQLAHSEKVFLLSVFARLFDLESTSRMGLGAIEASEKILSVLMPEFKDECLPGWDHTKEEIQTVLDGAELSHGKFVRGQVIRELQKLDILPKE